MALCTSRSKRYADGPTKATISSAATDGELASVVRLFPTFKAHGPSVHHALQAMGRGQGDYSMLGGGKVLGGGFNSQAGKVYIFLR